MTLNAVNSYAGTTTVAGGTLAAGAMNVFSAISDHSVAAGGILDLNGFDQTIGDLSNSGVVRFGATPGTTLSVSGDYAGLGGTIQLNTILGEDASPTDRLVVTGNTSGTSTLAVTNVGGAGAQTVEGIKVVDVAGVSGGAFSLFGDYVFEGDQAVVGGAYAYRLYQGSVSNPADGDWYLRSQLLDGGVLYQPGVPLYESYAGTLHAFNELGTLQQRVRNRSWAQPAGGAGMVTPSARITGVWGRIAASHGSFQPEASTSGADYELSTWKLETGADLLLADGEGGQLIGGVTLHYGAMSADIGSIFGDGSIDSTGYGLGSTLTWYGDSGFYLDGQAQVTLYDSDLKSTTAGLGLVRGNDGLGYGLGIEAGQRFALGPNWSVTPQAQLAYSAIDLDDFTDVFGADVSPEGSSSAVGRLGIMIDRQVEWQDGSGRMSRSHVYGIANLYQEFQGRSAVDVAGTRFESERDGLSGGLGIGGSLSWADAEYSLYGEALAKTGLENFGDSHSLSGTLGLRVRL
jgi:fibronectin-binding autotransporter adhesin